MKRINNYLTFSIKLLMFFLLLIIIYNRIVKMTYDYQFFHPSEYRDGALIDIANEFRENKNPFSMDGALPHSYTYGFIPPLLTGVVSQITNSSLITVQLTTSLVLILFTMLIVGFEIWKISHDLLLTLVGCIIVLIFSHVGFRLEMYAIFATTLVLIVINRKQTKFIYTYIFGAICVLLYYIKPYFVLLSAAIFSYYAHFDNAKSYLIRYLLSVIGCIIISFFFINIFWPMYFPQTFLNNLNMFNTAHFNWMIKQFYDFFLQNWSISSFFILLTIYSFINGKYKMFRNIFIIYVSVAVICLISSLGQNTGTYLTYYEQLLPIPIVLFIVKVLTDKNTRILILIKYAFIIVVIINYRQLIGIPINTNSTKSASWLEAVTYIKQNNPEKSYLSPHFTIIAIENSWPIYDNGQTDVFFATVFLNSQYKLFEYIFPQIKIARQIYIKWTEDLNKKVSDKQFSIIALPREYHALINDEKLNKNYGIDKTINLPINLGIIEFWKPL